MLLKVLSCHVTEYQLNFRIWIEFIWNKRGNSDQRNVLRSICIKNVINEMLLKKFDKQRPLSYPFYRNLINSAL